MIAKLYIYSPITYKSLCVTLCTIYMNKQYLQFTVDGDSAQCITMYNVTPVHFNNYYKINTFLQK